MCVVHFAMRLVLGCGSLLRVMMFTSPNMKMQKNQRNYKMVMWFTLIYVAVHLPPLCGPLVHNSYTEKIKESMQLA